MYMAVKHLGHIAASLIMGGRKMTEPVAIVTSATTKAQQVLETTLGEAAADLSASGLEPPAVVVVGEVVRLRAGLDWLGALTGRMLVADPLGNGRKIARGETA
jgi:uroporphyrin-III C-methyltransferase